MNPRLRLLPPAASTVSHEYDLVFWCLVVICTAVAVADACVLLYFAIRYRRRRDNELPPQISGNPRVEWTWTITPFIIFLGMFYWGARLYFHMERPPDNSREIYVVAKQWMWKLQHPEGQREINTLHVPVGVPIRLTMTSQDVIHSFFIPAFRIKQDVLPKRYTTIWFQADTSGKYHLFCAEYCGAKHSGMTGWIYAMNRNEYQDWLEHGAAEGSLASTGEKLFHQFGCSNCHHFDGHGPCPRLTGLYNRPVLLNTGETVTADETYLRRSILDPRAQIVAGFAALMPTFAGQLSEEQVIALIAYIKAMGPPPGSTQPSSSGSTPQFYGTEPGIGQPGATSIAGSTKDRR